MSAGHGLARQHGCRGKSFGLQTDGWCGDSPQDDTPDADGHRFFVERRLLAQARRALADGHLATRDMARAESLSTRLHEQIPIPPPVLLHGDLWQGNLHACGTGEPALIDASFVHYGWAEAELAMLTFFGTSLNALLATYGDFAPRNPDWHERIPLYNLYHLLNHLNLFGRNSLGSIRLVLARFG